MSIEAQLTELAEYAKRENLHIAETFIESKSAKKPGREILNAMLAKVHASKQPVGLLAWHPDRLARNSVDGGQIIYLIDTQKIMSLKFPTFWFEPTPQGLFMLQVAFGQSKYYSDNLSENVRRGIRQKLRRGEWPHLAPFGYVNDPKTRNIVPHPLKGKIVQKAFEEFADGKHTLASLGPRLSFWGVVGKHGKPICKATLQRMLTNPVYLGILKHNGESYEGKFPALVGQDTFDCVQEQLKRRAKPRHSKKQHDFPFRGLLTCGECGAAITAQYAKGNGGLYRYYRCTKRLGPCSQGYLQETELAEQLKGFLRSVALPEDWKDKMLARVEEWRNEEKQSFQAFAQTLTEQIKTTEVKLGRLVDSFLDGTIEKETYLIKKEELIKTKTALYAKKAEFGRMGRNWIEPLRKWILDAHHAQNLAFSEDYHGIRALAERIGTNRRLLSRKVQFDWAEPWHLAAGRTGRIDWSGCRDSNPGPPAPKAGALASCATPRWQGEV